MDRPRPLKIGFVLPTVALPAAGPAIRWTEMLAMARRAEEVGFDSIWTVDELVWTTDADEPLGFWECWAVLSAVAAVTSRVEIGSFVSCVSYRNPALHVQVMVAPLTMAGFEAFVPVLEAIDRARDHRDWEP
jgi:hypothetical protein